MESGKKNIWKDIKRSKNHICQKCAKEVWGRSNTLTQKEVENRLFKLNIEYKNFIYKNNHQKIEHKCIECGEWKSSEIQHIFKGNSHICKNCKINKKY